MLKTEEGKYAERKIENVKVKEGVESIEGTPFNSVEINEKFAITLGNNILKLGFETREEAEKYVQGLPWDVILMAAACYTDYSIKNKK